MPRQIGLTWNAKQRRWFKKYKGKQHSVSCSTLESQYPADYTSNTKEGSFRAANSWWADKLLEIDSHPQAAQILEGITIREKIALWCDLQSKPYKKLVLSEIATLKKVLRDRTPLSVSKGRSGQGAYSYLYIKETPINPFQTLQGPKIKPYPISKPEILEAIEIADNYQAQTGNGNYKLSDLLETFIDSEKRSLIRDRTIRRQVIEFLEFINSDDPNSIKALTLTNYKIHLEKSGQHWSTLKTKAVTVKAFIEWLYQQEVLETLPRNLKKFKIQKGEHSPQFWTDAEIKTLFKYVTGENRLFCLLALNCGMYAVDIAHLKPSDVDWENGRIKSKRHKTNKGGSLYFELWDETFNLLKEFGNREGKYIFSTNTGKCLWSDGTKNQIGKRYSTFKNSHGLKNKIGHFKDLRKTGRNKLEESPEFRNYALFYLQDSTNGVDQSYYRVPNQNEFSKMCHWLGKQFNF